MKYLLKIFIILFLASSALSQSVYPLQDGTVLALVDKERGCQLTNVEDEYTAILSPFDLQSKVPDKKNAVLKDYLAFACSELREWTDKEKASFEKMTSSISAKISKLGLKINMPDTIFIIKSRMGNEGGAEGFTRGTCIYLKQDMTESSNDMENVLIHEMFHVLSRYDKNMRERVYNTLGFKICNEVPYPKEIADLRISNPDAPHNNFYISVNKDGKPFDAMLVLYASGPFQGGSFFFYIKTGLMQVEGDSLNKKPVYAFGKPVIYELDAVKNFYEQIGRNTGYVIHTEEICADHFVMLLDQTANLRNPYLIDKMLAAMK